MFIFIAITQKQIMFYVICLLFAIVVILSFVHQSADSFNDNLFSCSIWLVLGSLLFLLNLVRYSLEGLCYLLITYFIAVHGDPFTSCSALYVLQIYHNCMSYLWYKNEFQLDVSVEFCWIN